MIGTDLIICDSCDGDGFRYNHPLASRKGPCRECGGSGEVEAES